MMAQVSALLRQMLQAAYLYALNPAAEGAWRAVHTGCLLALALGTALVWAWAQRRRRTGHSPLAGRLAAVCFGLALALLMLRFYVGGPLSARVGWLSAATLGLMIPLLAWLAGWRWPWLRALGRALALRDDATQHHKALGGLVLLLVQVAALGGAIALDRAPAWLALAAALLWVLACWSSGNSTSPRQLRPELLAPWLLADLAALLRWLVDSGLGVDTAVYAAFPYPDLWSPWFAPRVTWGLALVWAALIAGKRLAEAGAPGRRNLPPASVLAYGAFALAAGWFAAVAWRHHSHGATGSDPYCYLQMALDLARTGQLSHAFPLTELAQRAQVPLWPLVPVGYHPPGAGGLAATVWPSGWPVLLAPFAWLGGEGLASVAAPLFALLAAWWTYRAARTLWPEQGSLAGGLAALLLLTAPEGLLRALVPMADAAAQAMVALLLLALARARRNDALRWSAVAGAALGLAYWVRHPLILLAPALLPLVTHSGWPWRRRWDHLLAVAAGMASFLALDLAYRWGTFGAPWATESREWGLIALRYLPEAWGRLLAEGWLLRGEFGFFWPLIAVGCVAGACGRSGRRWTGWLLLAAFLPPLAFQLCYRALRWRDLISLFPILALWAGYGAARLWSWARPTTLCRTATLLLVLWCLLARTAGLLDLPWRPGVSTFGAITAPQRAAYDALAAELPPDAVLAAGLGAGALAHYVGREALRPAAWSSEEWQRMAAELARSGRPIYLLDDGAEMAAWIEEQQRTGAGLKPAGRYDLPRFGPGGEVVSGAVRCYRLLE
jgi:hypothetical protein